METAVIDIARDWPVLAVFLVAFVFFWKISSDNRKGEHDNTIEQRAWQKEMGEKRDAEQDRRDTAWREFLAGMQTRSDAATLRSTEVQAKLIERMDVLTATINRHDDYTRARLVKYDNLADVMLTDHDK